MVLCGGSIPPRGTTMYHLIPADLSAVYPRGEHMYNKIIRAIYDGASNKAIARFLNEADYVVYTYGWDEIRQGVYYEYGQDGQWHPDHAITLDDLCPRGEMEDFYYANYVDPAMVASIRSKICGSSDISSDRLTEIL